MNTKSNIYDLKLSDFPAVVEDLGLKKYAANQIISWLYKKRVSGFDEMTNLTKAVRETLNQKFTCEALKIDKTLEAKDGTKKYRFKLSDGELIEAVDMPMEKRRTVCISTQVGCAMNCAVCRTATLGLKRNLTQGEIVGQLLTIMNQNATPVTNVVLMGMGEPLANYEAVKGAVEIMIDTRAIEMSYRRVTLSTCGLIPELKRFVNDLPVMIAISLSATTDEVRSKIMPINKKYSIAKIMEFCREHSKDSKNRITIEYVLIGDVNDSKEDAARLVKLLRGVKAKINLIPFNSFEGCEYKSPSEEIVDFWYRFLHEKGIQTNVRVSRGHEIMAACGQLISV
ncbi:MAG: 23S rRNA (adenine(2503)-C(2))-methyltransferase RlmN [Pseudomonadota bacterium]